MSVHVVADTVVKLSALRAILEQRYAVTSELLGGAGIRCSESGALVVAADLRIVETIAALKEVFGRLSHVRKRIFLVDQKARLFTVQAYALGATRVLINPVNQANLLAQLADSTPCETGSIDPLHGASEAATAGAIAIGSKFSSVLNGKAHEGTGANA